MNEKFRIAVEEYVGRSLLWTYTRGKKNHLQNEGGIPYLSCQGYI